MCQFLNHVNAVYFQCPHKFNILGSLYQFDVVCFQSLYQFNMLCFQSLYQFNVVCFSSLNRLDAHFQSVLRLNVVRF